MNQIQERRAWVRFDCALRSTCRAVGEPTPQGWSATVLNVSAGGICLRLAHHIDKGSILLIEIQGENRITLQARTIHVQDLGSGYFEIGCSLLRELDEAELKNLIL